MATKLEIDEVMAVIHENVKDPETKNSLIEDIKKIQAEKEAEKEEERADKGPKAKNKHVFFVRKDENGKFSEAGFLAKCPIESDNNTLLPRIQTAAAQQNNKPRKSNRGRRRTGGKIEKYYDFFHGCKREFTKPVDIQPVQELVEIVILPSEEIDFSK